MKKGETLEEGLAKVIEEHQEEAKKKPEKFKDLGGSKATLMDPDDTELTKEERKARWEKRPLQLPGRPSNQEPIPRGTVEPLKKGTRFIVHLSFFDGIGGGWVALKHNISSLMPLITDCPSIAQQPFPS